MTTAPPVAPSVAPLAAPSPPPPPAFVVTLVSGKTAAVQSMQEQEWFTDAKRKYLAETKFTETTDLIDLDRLLILELMIFRWTQWLAAGEDYVGDMINEKELTANLKLYSDQINKVKTTMGLTKAARDEMASEGNFAKWLADLKSRAKIFGVHREKQLTKALTLMNELSTVVGTFDRTDEEERRRTGFASEAEILAWIRETMLPEFVEIDTYFQEHEQRYWVRDL